MRTVAEASARERRIVVVRGREELDVLDLVGGKVSVRVREHRIGVVEGSAAGYAGELKGSRVAVVCSPVEEDMLRGLDLGCIGVAEDMASVLLAAGCSLAAEDIRLVLLDLRCSSRCLPC